MSARWIAARVCAKRRIDQSSLYYFLAQSNQGLVSR
jgi:hypothetical protein